MSRASNFEKIHCLIVDDMHPSIIEDLGKANIEVHYCPEFGRAKIKEALKGMHILVIRSKTSVDEDLLRQANKLWIIARAGAGMDNISEEVMSNEAIIKLNAPEGNRDAVGDHTLGLILSLLNNIPRSYEQIKGGIWDREGNRGDELSEMTVAVIGYGNTGRAVTDRLLGFGCRILVYDKYVHGYGNNRVIESTWEDIFKEADLVTFHVPLTYETKAYINGQFLSRFEKSIYLINASRGGIMQQTDLLEGLNTNKVKGIALDVLENEKIDQFTAEEKLEIDSIIKHPRTIITPHVAGWTKASYRKISNVICDKILIALNKIQ